MREFLEFVIRQLIEFPDDLVLTEIPSGRTTIFKLQLRRGDVGRVIGRGGQTIQAIRALLASSAARHGELKAVRLSPPIPERTVSLLLRRDAYRSAAARAFLRLLTNADWKAMPAETLVAAGDVLT